MSEISKETYSLCEVVADLMWNLVSDVETDRIPPLDPDSRETVRLVIVWAHEFEQKNKGREWNGEYMEEIDKFYSEKIKAHHQEPQPLEGFTTIERCQSYIKQMDRNGFETLEGGETLEQLQETCLLIQGGIT